MSIAIILCYGLFEETNQEYKDYLEWCAKDIKANNSQKVIICGGHTNNVHPEISEAQSVLSYLQQFLGPEVEVILEDQSLTTPQNLEFASQKISSTDQIVVYCDLARLAKIIWLSAHFLIHKNRQEISHTLLEFYNDKKIKPFTAWNLVVSGFDFPSRDKYLYFAQSFTSLLEVESLTDKELDAKIIAQRKKDFGLI